MNTLTNPSEGASEKLPPNSDESNPIARRPGGYFMAVRGETGLELLRASPCAFILLYVIAHRARWHPGFNQYELSPGEALIGDYSDIGLTEQNYRTAKKQLEKWKFATFRPTNKGTIATLIDTRVFDINLPEGNDQSNTRLTDSQRTGNGQLTTNKKDKKDKRRTGEVPQARFPKDFRIIIDAKKEQAADLRNRHYTDGPLGGKWNDESARLEYKKLDQDIKRLTKELADMVT